MLFNQTFFTLVVAAILFQLSSVQARPLPVPDIDSSVEPRASGSQSQERSDDSSNYDHASTSQSSGHMQTASFKDACTDGSIGCIDDLLVVCVGSRWNRDERYTRKNRKRSSVEIIDVSCASPKSGMSSGPEYKDEKKGKYKYKSTSEVDAYPTSSYSYSTVVATTTLSPEQAKEEVSRLMSSATSTMYYTSTETPCSTSSTPTPTQTVTATAAPDSTTTDCSYESKSTKSCGQYTDTDADCDSDYEDSKSESSDEYDYEDYPASSATTKSDATSTYTSLTAYSTSPATNQTQAIGNIRLTTMPLIVPTATANTTIATPLARIDQADGEVVPMRLTTGPAMPTSTPAEY